MLFRVWNGGLTMKAYEYCYVLADDRKTAAEIGKAFLGRLDLLPDPDLMPGEPKAARGCNPPLEKKMIEIGRLCTMSESERTLPVIPEGYPPADRADELTAEQMRHLMDNHGHTVRELAGNCLSITRTDATGNVESKLLLPRKNLARFVAELTELCEYGI